MLFTHLGDTKRQPDAVKVKYSCPGLFIGHPNKALPISSLTRFKGPELSRQKMFGEHSIDCDEKLVAPVCDDQLFVKKTPAEEKKSVASMIYKDKVIYQILLSRRL